ncbi:MAG: GNAT family N-acetyltransferase [Candidatus Hermodarchaeota archaeon]
MSLPRMNFKKRRLRSIFLTFEKESKTTNEIEDDLITSGLEYIQMKLSVARITPEFEKRITEKIERNILRAKIREAKLEDLESVVALYNRSWMTSNTPYSPLSLESTKVLFEYPETKILIAKVYGYDAGFVILDYEGPHNQYGIIAGLGVIPRYQRKGLGTVLGVAAWNYFREQGVKELRCEVFKDNKVSYNFIKSLGFEEFGTKIYKHEDFDAYL